MLLPILTSRYSQTLSIRTQKGTQKVTLLTGCLYLAGHVFFKAKKNLLLEQNTKEIKEDISIITLNFSNLNIKL